MYWLIFTISTIYYSLLATKSWSWIFTGQDTGDWLASAWMRFTPQPYGSPLYVLLIKIIPGMGLNPVIWAPILLSSIPAAITVTLVASIVQRKTNSNKAAIASSAAILGASIFLTQATIVEEYTFAVMWVVLAFWAWQRDKKWLVMLSIGLGGAVHIIVLAVAGIWAMIEYQNWRNWIKFAPLALLPLGLYGITLATMADPNTFKWISGNLSWQSLSNYVGSSSYIGGMAISETPKRLWQALILTVPLFGICWVEIVLVAKNFKQDKLILVCLATILFSFWLYLTNKDYTTWTFLCYGIPFAAVLFGIGYNKWLTQDKEVAAILLMQSMILIGLNTMTLNANYLANLSPRAEVYKEQLMDLPGNAVLIVPSGGAFGLGYLYVVSLGKELTPIMMSPSQTPTERSQVYTDYLEQQKWRTDIAGITTMERINDALAKNYTLYIPQECWAGYWQDIIEVENSQYSMLYKIKSADEDYQFSEE